MLSVGLQSGKADIVRGERFDEGIVWNIELGVRPGRDGEVDFFGPLVHGKRGERFLYVSWGTTVTSEHDMFRRLKLYLGPLNRASWSQAGIGWDMVGAGGPISVRISGRGPDGTPHCGTAPAHWNPVTGKESP